MSRKRLTRISIVLSIVLAFSYATVLAAQTSVATGEVPVAGTITGSHVDTQAVEGICEAIQEVESGGKPSKRHSYLEHKWTFNVPAGASVVFFIKGYHTPNPEGDDFDLAWSVDDQVYTTFLQVTKTSDDGLYDSAPLPANLSGTVYIRVMDADRTQGNLVLDTLFVDHMVIESTGGEIPPAAPSDLEAVATSSSAIQLAWIDNANNEDGFRIERSLDGATWLPHDTVGADITTFEDAGLEEGATYFYIVQAFNTYGDSGWSNVASATTSTGGFVFTYIERSISSSGGNIMIVPADGSDPIRVYRGTAIWPRLSPDGSQIAFMATKGNTTSLYVINTDGTGLINLCPINFFIPSALGLDWSPDGSKIAFSDMVTVDDHDIFTIRPDGTDLTNLTNTPGSLEYRPTWSPTGDRLVVCRMTPWPGDLIVLHLDPNGFVIGETNITNIPGSPLQNTPFPNHAWARTSDKVVVTVPEQGDMSPHDIWLIDLADPGNPIDLTNTWGIDERVGGFDDLDQKIYYRREFNGKDAIWRMNADGTNQSVFLYDAKYDLTYPYHRR